jgi:hypothetical protein
VTGARLILSILTLSLLSACTAPMEEPVAPPVSVEMGGVLFDHSTVIGVLRLVNDPASDLAFLMDAVGILNAPADAIVRHRQGDDRLDGTWDDDPFDDGFELSDLPDVGAVSMHKLAAAAQTLDLVPDLMLEGVYFSRAQLEAALLLANTVSLSELDGALETRAAQSLVLGRPYESIHDIAERPRMGPSALTALRDLASEWLDSGDDTVES